MDHSSSASITSGTPAAPSPTPIQPTYTTAGTIYNPSSSQPLQPPARRGRCFKWAPSGPHSELGLIPRSVLAALPLKPGNGSRVPTISSFQHYTPLQQNYDRAVSPVSEPEHEVVRMPLQAPRLRPIHNIGSVPSFPPLNPPKIIDNNTDDDDDDDDSDFGMDPLMNMTVKSLHNLASYPNPNQKRAQKALLRGAKPNLASLTAASRMTAPPVYPTFGSFEPSKDTGDRPLSLLRQTMSESSGLHRSLADSRSKLFEFGRASTFIPGESRLPSPAPTSDAVDITPSTSMTLASGPGAPRPLTAGPPGLRQYRPSTFESTFRALQTKSRPESRAFDDSEVLSITQQALLQAGVEDLTPSSDPFPPQFRLTPQPYSDFAPNGPILPSGLERGAMSSSETQRDEFSMDSASTYNSLQNNMAAQSIWSWQSESKQTNWDYFSSFTQLRFQPGTDRLADEEIEARNRRINRQWYAGTGIFGKIEDHVAVVDYPSRIRKNIYGAVGEGRPTKNDQPDVRKDQKEAGPSSVWKADQVSSSSYARLFVNAAFTSMLRSAEEEESSPKVTPSVWPRDKEMGKRSSCFGNTF